MARGRKTRLTVSERSNLATDSDTATSSSGGAPAPRAALIKLPLPRAELVRLPEWQIGETQQLLMPNGLKVLGTLKGRVPSQDLLPAAGNQIGDAWLVGDDVWIFVVAPSTATPTWIDP
jgi:hypothetical protein